ncbi:MAG: hypothetical protein ABSC31_04825 [Acidimicrobiales bacterium]
MPEYVNVARLAVPVGWRVIVVSDLFLSAKRTEASGPASVELARALERAEGPGAVVVAGNAFDLLVPPGGDPAAALGAHRELRQALACYLAADRSRRAILLPGNRDRSILYDTAANAAVSAAGFEVALTVQLQVATAVGPKLVCIEPGWRFDERNAFVDPADRRDTPLGHHAVAEILPALAGSSSPWLAGIDRLIDPSACPVSWPPVSPTAASCGGSGGSWFPSWRRFSRGSPTTGCSACLEGSSPSRPGCSAWGSRSWSR